MTLKERRNCRGRDRPSHIDQAKPFYRTSYRSMPTKTNDAISRSDRVLVAALGIILATASAAIGASLTYHPAPEKVVALPAPAVQVAEEAPVPVADAVMAQLLAEHKCLSEVLYYEARGEGLSGQK